RRGVQGCERRGVAHDLQAQERALPGRQQKVGEIFGAERGVDLTRGLRVRNAGDERSAPFDKDGGQPLAQQVTVWGRLEAEVADQAAALKPIGLKALRNDVEIAPQALARRQPLVVERLAHQALEVEEIAVEDLAREGFLGAEMVGEGTLGRGGLGYDVADAAPAVAFPEHDAQTGVQDAVAKGCFCHAKLMRTYVLMSSGDLRAAD